MIYIVTAIAVNPRTLIMETRTEKIDTETNELFEDAAGPWDVEDRYEEFWNRLNASWEHDFPSYKDKVKVISVEPVR